MIPRHEESGAFFCPVVVSEALRQCRRILNQPPRDPFREAWNAAPAEDRRLLVRASGFRDLGRWSASLSWDQLSADARLKIKETARRLHAWSGRFLVEG